MNSRQVEFTLTGERFPIDLVGSYDVDKAKAIIAEAPRTSKAADVNAWGAFAEHMEWEQLDGGSEIDCSVPVIIATVSEAKGHYLLIDGWHRVHKAKVEGRDVIQAFYLTEAETIRVFEIAMVGFDAGCSFA